jgi:hypothetical protein
MERLEMRRALIAVVLLTGTMTGTARADMPDCLSGICLRTVYSPESFKKAGFVAKPNECEGIIEYTKNEKNIRVRVVVLDYAVDGNEANMPHSIRRYMEFGREAELRDKITNAFLEKYGEPKQKSLSRADPDASASLMYGEEGRAGKMKRASAYRVWPRGIWATAEELEDFRGYDDYLTRWNRCEDMKKANKAKRIIPD